jgi:hypothetical protein
LIACCGTCATPERLMQGNVLMLTDWNRLTDEAQLALSREALRRAVEIIADQAEVLAEEMKAGTLSDRGGADALRLLAAIVRVSGEDSFRAAGYA